MSNIRKMEGIEKVKGIRLIKSKAYYHPYLSRLKIRYGCGVDKIQKTGMSFNKDYATNNLSINFNSEWNGITRFNIIDVVYE